MEDRIETGLAFVEKIKKDLIKLRSLIWEQMSDAQKKQCYQDEVDNDISIKNIISFFNEHSDRIKKEIDNPNFQDLFNKRLDMKITCFDNFWEELAMKNKFTLEDYIYVPIEPELARKLLEKHKKDWEPFDEFNGFYHCLKDTLEDFDNRFRPEKEESEF